MTYTSITAAMTSFTFDADNEGWAVLDYTGGRLFTGEVGGPAGITPMGNPGGAIIADDPNADEGARFSAPTPFIGNASSLVGANLTFDLTVLLNFVPNTYTLSRALGLVYIENDTSGDGLLYTGALPDDGWTTYSVTIGPNAAPLTLSPEAGLGGLPVPDEGFWAYIPDTSAIGAAFVDPTAMHFSDVLGGVTRFTITGEVLDGPSEILALDNVHLTLVPIPAALPLLLSALFGLVVAGRRTTS